MPGSLQVHALRAPTAPSISATNYFDPINGQVWNTVEARGTVLCTAAGTFSNWSIVLPTAPGASKSFIFTLRVNGVDTAAVIPISGSATSGTYLSAVALADGDEITIKCVPSGTPTNSTPSVCWDFTSTTAGESIYGLASGSATITANRVGRVLCHMDQVTWDAVGTPEVVGCAGAITKATIKLDVDVTASGSITFTITKNGVDQDGTAGTPDTRITFATGTTQASAIFSLAVTPGDLLTWKVVRTGTPATVRPTTGVRLLATTPGQSHFGSVTAGSFPVATTHYFAPGQGCVGTGDTTEANRAVTLGPSGFTLRNLRVALNSVTSAGTGYAFTLRQNGASTAHTVSLVAVTSGSITASTVYVAGDRLAMSVANIGTPAGRSGGWAWTQEAVAAVTVVERSDPFLIYPV